jgi:hypothetical protein
MTKTGMFFGFDRSDFFFIGRRNDDSAIPAVLDPSVLNFGSMLFSVGKSSKDSYI